MILLSWCSYILLISFILVKVDAKCPNHCSGHGQCNWANNTCLCNERYKIAADCSLKKCVSGQAWASKANGQNRAHQWLECSNNGKCNRQKGRCECFPGYEGDACQRSTCNCGPNGRCMTIGQVYKDVFVNVDNAVASNYSKWDRDQTTMCVCDFGYTGSACELRICPKGDDPLTLFSDFRTILMTIGTTSTEKLSGTVKFTFNGANAYFPANGNQFSYDQCQKKFSSLPNIETVKCFRSIPDYWGNVQYVIKIHI